MQKLPEYHVTYWTAKDKSTGVSVNASSILEAVAIVQSSYGVPLDQIIYAHARESVYVERSQENEVQYFTDMYFLADIEAISLVPKSPHCLPFMAFLRTEEAQL